MQVTHDKVVISSSSCIVLIPRLRQWWLLLYHRLYLVASLASSSVVLLLRSTQLLNQIGQLLNQIGQLLSIHRVDRNWLTGSRRTRNVIMMRMSMIVYGIIVVVDNPSAVGIVIDVTGVIGRHDGVYCSGLERKSNENVKQNWKFSEILK